MSAPDRPAAPNPDPWPKCEKCDGDGYTETWNDDQSDVIITLCNCQAVAQGIEESWLDD